jgi:hypothetical protein
MEKFDKFEKQLLLEGLRLVELETKKDIAMFEKAGGTPYITKEMIESVLIDIKRKLDSNTK